MFGAQARRRVVAVTIGILLILATMMVAYGVVSAESVRTAIITRMHRVFKVQNLVVKVIPFQSDYWTQQGRFQTILVTVDRAEQKTVAIRNVYIKGFDVTLDLEELFEKSGDVKTKSRKRAIFSARVYKSDLNKLLALKKTPIKNIKVDFQGDKLVLTGTYQFAFGHKLRMVGKLKLENHSKLSFIPTAASVNGIPLPAGPLRVMLNNINPLIEFRNIPLSPRVDKIEIKDDYILVKG